MFGFWNRRKTYREEVRCKAAALIEAHGDAAYEFVRSRRIATLQQGDLVAHQFWSAIARVIALHIGREVGLDTATRYTSASCEHLTVGQRRISPQ